MQNINVRNIDSQVIAGLDDMASKKQISRNELIKNILTDAVEMQGIKSVENKYETLILKLEEVLKNNMLLNKRILDHLDNK